MLGCCARSSVACVLLATALAGCVSLPERDVSIELCKRVEIGDPNVIKNKIYKLEAVSKLKIKNEE